MVKKYFLVIGRLLSRNKVWLIIFVCLTVTLFNSFKVNDLKSNLKNCYNNNIKHELNSGEENSNLMNKILFYRNFHKNKAKTFIKNNNSIFINNSNATIDKMSKEDVELIEIKRLFNISQQTSSSIKFADVFELLPHLANQTINKKAFTPRIQIGKNRQAKYLIAIPTVKREESYLAQTLKSLFASFKNQSELEQVVVVIQISEINDYDFIQNLLGKIVSWYKSEIERGIIELIVPPQEFYPNLNELNIRDEVFGDNKERISWRVKQVYDVVFLMNYCYKRGEFYLQLEDDIISSVSFLSEIDTHLKSLDSRIKHTWKMIEYSELGFIGKLFRCADLPLFMNMFLIYSFTKPVDLIHNIVFEAISCDPAKPITKCEEMLSKVKVKYKPSLFQHIGAKSSLKGKLQPIKDPNFKDQVQLVKHVNPDAKVTTTLRHYQAYTIDSIYMGRDFFWAEAPLEESYINIKFNKPFYLRRYTIVSSNNMHPFDLFPENTILEMKLFSASLSSIFTRPQTTTTATASKPSTLLTSTNSNTLSNNHQKNVSSISIKQIEEKYIRLAQTDTKNRNFIGTVDLSLYGNLSVSEVRICIPRNNASWILISEMGFV